MGIGSSRHYLALDTSHRPVTPRPHHSSKTMVVPLVQGALYFLQQRLVRKHTFLRRRSGRRPPPTHRVRATLLHFNQNAASSKAAPNQRPNRARNRALAKGRSYNCGHHAQGRRTLGRAWRRVDPRWQVDLQHTQTRQRRGSRLPLLTSSFSECTFESRATGAMPTRLAWCAQKSTASIRAASRRSCLRSEGEGVGWSDSNEVILEIEEWNARVSISDLIVGVAHFLLV